MGIGARLSQKWKTMPPTVRASLCFSIAMFIQKGILSLATPIFTRSMSPVEYEQYTVYNAWSNILTIVATLNLSSGVLNNQLVEAKYSREKIVSAFQGLSSLWAAGFLLLAAAVYMIGFRVSSMPGYLWFLMLASFMVTPAYEIWIVSRRFTYDYRMPCIIMVIVAIANFLISLAAVLLSDCKGEAKIFTAILINMFTGCALWVYNYRHERTLYKREIWKAALCFNLPLIPHFLSLTVLNQSDKIMIEAMCPPGSAAIYSVAHTVAAIIQLMMTAVNYSLIPWTYQRLKAGENATIAKRSNMVLWSVAVALICIMLFAPEVMRIMAPDEYQEAIYIIPAMAAGLYFNYLYQFYGRIELYHKKTRYMMFGSVMCAAVNIVLNHVFIRCWGYQAAAYTTLFCQMGLSIMHALLTNRLIRKMNYKQTPVDNRTIALISLAVLLGAALILMMYDILWLRMGCIVMIAAAACVKRRKIRSLIQSYLK